MVAGSMLLTLGGTTILVGAPLFASVHQVCTTNGRGLDCAAPGSSAFTGLMVGGAMLALIGIPLIAYGARYEPGNEVAAGRALPRWAGGPAANGWAWSF